MSSSSSQLPSSDKDNQQQQPHKTHNKQSHSHSHSHSHSRTTPEADGADAHSHSHSAGSSLLHHHHSAHEPNEFLAAGTSSIKSNPAVRITWIGLIVNVALAVSKGIGGVVFHSQALVADAIHSVSDMLADFLTLATVNVAAKVGTPTKFPLDTVKLKLLGLLLLVLFYYLQVFQWDGLRYCKFLNLYFLCNCMKLLPV